MTLKWNHWPYVVFFCLFFTINIPIRPWSSLQLADDLNQVPATAYSYTCRHCMCICWDVEEHETSGPGLLLWRQSRWKTFQNVTIVLYIVMFSCGLFPPLIFHSPLHKGKSWSGPNFSNTVQSHNVICTSLQWNLVC